MPTFGELELVSRLCDVAILLFQHAPLDKFMLNCLAPTSMFGHLTLIGFSLIPLFSGKNRRSPRESHKNAIL